MAASTDSTETPDPYVPTVPAPAPWRELNANSGRPLRAAYQLLELTFPHRYLHLDLPAMRRKLLPTRDVPSVVQQNTRYLIRSLRVFTWSEPVAPHTMRIAAFFFLRLYHQKTMAYSLSVGIDDPAVAPTFDAGDVHDRLLAICQYMQQQDCIKTIDVVNQRVIGNAPNDPLDDTQGRSDVVRGAFDLATTPPQNQEPTLVDFGEIFPGPPWPSKLHRWQVV